jgi:hypothetical protein
VVDASMSQTLEEGAQSPSWPNGLILLKTDCGNIRG